MSSMNTVSLFTTFAPFGRRAPSERRCAVVTREKRLLIANLEADGDDATQDTQVSYSPSSNREWDGVAAGGLLLG